MTTDSFTDEVKLPSSPTDSAPTRRKTQFPDLFSAGRDLAAVLENYGSEETVVVAIARGGVPVAMEVATHLGAPLDVLLIRRMLPRGPGSVVCAVNVCGTLVMDQDLPSQSPVPQTPLDYFIDDALSELALRERTCRGARPALEIAEKNVILVASLRKWDRSLTLLPRHNVHPRLRKL